MTQRAHPAEPRDRGARRDLDVDAQELSEARTAGLISVILPCSSAPVAQVRDTLESIIDQRLPAEVLIVGADTSEVRTLLEDAPLDPSINVCLADTIAEAMGRVRCDIVGIQSAGDLYLPGAFELAVDALGRDQSAEIAYADVCAIGDDGALLARQRSSPRFNPARYLARVTMIHRSGALFRRTLVDRARDWCVAEDPGDGELWMRMVLAANPVKLVVPLAAVRAARPEGHHGEQWSAYGRVIHWLDQGNGSWRLRRAASAGRRLLALDHGVDKPRAARALDVALALLTYPPAVRAADWPRVANRRRVRRGRRRPPANGWDLVGSGSYDATLPLPPGAETKLSDDNPRLRDLRERYAAFDSALCVHSFWADEYRSRDLELRYFRGDNAFVWQYRNMREQTALRYSLYLRHLASIDRRSCLETLEEDGAFGCWAFEFPGFPPVSRDLLDSINEMYFIDRAWGLFDRREFSVLDIGAGYGRLAQRMSAAVPGLSRYYCTDGVPESTFLSEYYLSFRGVDQAEVVPADDLDRLPAGEIDLALNIHSFSEMSRETIAAWLDLLVRLRVPRLLVVPNDPDAFLSYETDHTRLEFGSILESHGYKLRVREPVIPSRHLRQLIGMWDNFYFFERPDLTA